MTLLPDSANPVASADVFCRLDVAKRLARIATLRNPRQVGQVVVFDGDITEHQASRAGLSVRRLLDRHFIVYDANDVESAAVAERALFDSLAARYENEIDAELNAANITELLSLVEAPENGLVMDYGCGTGLSMTSPAAKGLRLLGFDQSAAMLAVAAARGLHTMDVTHLQSNGCPKLDGIIASFVLHLSTSTENLERVARELRPSRRLAANFHKLSGVDQASIALEAAGCSRLRLTRVRADVVVWSRDG